MAAAAERSSDMTTIATDLDRTRKNQAAAADPAASVWVAANAGTGKTHVLTNRVLRLLLAGTRPECILCLTYTKAAAAEMSKRVFDKLAGWVTSNDLSLGKALGDLLGRSATAEERARSRALFALAIETPGGLKVQTIHAFCERLLQRFPLEAGVAPSFTILDDEMGRTLLREATDAVLSEAAANPDTDLGHALKAAIVYAVEDGFDTVLREALSNREWLQAAVRMRDDKLEGLAATEQLYRRHAGIANNVSTQSLDWDMAGLISEVQLRRLAGVLVGGKTKDGAAARTIRAALAASSPAGRAAALASYFFNGRGEPRKILMTKDLKTEHPDLDELVTRAQDRFVVLHAQRSALDLVTATMALTRLAEAVLQGYGEAKARRAALDFDDLIQRTRNLLATGGSAQWVLYKLDNGIEHILVDESQDTAPAQWDVIQALAGEFFSGEGTADKLRTVFAVGDEKQSIYSFQGAAPEMFERMGELFSARAQAAGATFRKVPLNLSFRTVQPVLDAVDTVFSNAARTPGLTASAGTIRHVAFRNGQAGHVEIWPSEAHVDPDETDVFSPLAEKPVASPVTRLAERIAGTIEHWLRTGERLVSEDRAIEAGDVLILVRRRNPFAPAMVAALKARGIPVAGADRIRITDQIAVKDLVALGDFLVLPEDDLSLAAVLKSPLFGLTDDDLLTFAPRRKKALWSALLDQAKTNARLVEAAETLKRWRSQADFLPPFEFLASLLGRDGMRARMLGRLGPDAADPIDELLSLALSYDDGAPPSLQGFLTWLKQASAEIKRDMEHGRNEVRVMTVHGAKGLEAPIVFLPDTCSASSGRQQGGLLRATDMHRPEGVPTPFIWPVNGTANLDIVCAAKAERSALEAEERNRLLYVAMTRARDRLYVTGYEGRKGRAKGCWYDQVEQGLDALLRDGVAADGGRMRYLASEQTAPHDKPKRELMVEVAPAALPDWAQARAPTEPRLAVPLAPSRLAPYDTDENGEPSEPQSQVATQRPREQEAPSPRQMSDQNRFLRGTITHALLEHLPTLPAETWSEAARGFVAKRGAALSQSVREGIAAETLAILHHPEFAPLFGPDSRPEVPIAADIARPRGKGPSLRIAGSIDRLAHAGDTLLIVDYKTNRPPPREVWSVADAYLFQLAAYALAVEQIFATKKVRAALLWTDGPRIMEIPESVLSEYQSRLWDIDPGQP